MARTKKDPAASEGEKPSDGCVFMWRRDQETGTIQCAEVESRHGSVEVMAAQGWTLDQPKE